MVDCALCGAIAVRQANESKESGDGCTEDASRSSQAIAATGGVSMVMGKKEVPTPFEQVWR